MRKRRVLLLCYSFGLLLLPQAALAEDDILDSLDAPVAKPDDKSADDKPDIAEEVDASAKPPKPAAKDGAEQSVDHSALDKVKAVPRKSLLKRKRFELSPMFSLSANDSYYQHFAAAGSAVFYPHDALGIGVGAEWLYAHVKNDTVDAVRKNLTSVPAVFEHPKAFVHADVYWTPVYGKLSLFDDLIINYDFYASVGLGAAFVGDRTPPMAVAGLGQRFALSDFLALRFEVRDFVFVDSQEVNGIPRSDIQNYVMFLAGVSIFVPPSFDYTF